MKPKFKFPWQHKKLYMYPNRFGMIFFGLFAISIMVGATYNNNLIFLMGFILISFLFVCILITAKNLRGIEIKDIQVSPGFPGETVPAKIIIDNPDNSEHTSLILKLDSFDSEAQLSHIGPKDSTSVLLSLKLPDKRGIYSTERVRVATENPFGLFYSWFWFRIKKEHVVYPKPSGNKLRPRIENQTGDEFSGLKEYEVGDPLSRVSWKHMAKSDDLLVKEFNDSELTEDLLRIEEAPQPNFEQKLSQMSLWLLEAEKSQRLYAMEGAKSIYSANRGPKHLENCLNELARWPSP